MDQATTGGFMLLGLIILFLLPVIIGAAALVKGHGRLSRIDRDRAVRRDVSDQYRDAILRQEEARRLLDKYGR